jgi:ribonuclease P protein component
VPVPTVSARAWPPRAAADCWRAGAPRAASVSVRKALLQGNSIRKLTFEPRKRLHQPAEFRDVKRRGRKFADAYFTLSVLANHETYPRLGLSIATRTFGTAVARNRIKRLARESFRLNQHSLPPVDVTLFAKDAARLAKSLELRASLDQHWKSITQRW